MTVHRYLFWIENNMVRLYCYDEINKTFEIIRKQGEELISVNDDVLTWWKEEASFNSNKDTIDFCIVYDKEYEFLKNINLDNTEKSIWSKNLLEVFVNKFIEHSKIHLINGDSYCDFNKQNSMFSDNDVKTYYTNIKLSFSKSESSVKDSDNNGEVSILAEFFIKKLKKEKED